MSTMKRFGMMTMILGGALAAFGCSAPGSSSGNNGTLAQGDGGTLGNPFGNGPTTQNPSAPAGASVTPKSFCTDLDAWLTKCGSTPAAGSEATCEQSYQKYSASQLTASEACFKQITTCDSTALSQCLKDAVAAGGTTPTTPTTPGTQTCDQCVTAQCSAQVAGCKANPDCVTLYTCLQSAKTQADAQTCEDQSPNGVTDLQTFAQCVTGPCGSVCK